MRNRDIGIDNLKCLAALMITWSHFEKPLGEFSMLATGGAFGNCCFFFCSGYTLFQSLRYEDFFNWYKHRINRIYPTVFAWALLNVVFFGDNRNMLDILLYGGGFFVTVIMIFYIFFYFFRRKSLRFLIHLLPVTYILLSSSYFLFDQSNTDVNYKWLWSMYFPIMLFGGIMGKLNKEGKDILFSHIGKIEVLIGLFVAAGVYYGLKYMVDHNTNCKPLQTLYILPQFVTTYCFYLLCRSVRALNIHEKRIAHAFIMIVGGLCLEIYIVQPNLLTDKLNDLFPLNLVIIYILIFIVAYILRCVSRIWTQTFSSLPYDWYEVVKLY